MHVNDRPTRSLANLVPFSLRDLGFVFPLCSELSASEQLFLQLLARYLVLYMHGIHHLKGTWLPTGGIEQFADIMSAKHIGQGVACRAV